MHATPLAARASTGREMSLSKRAPIYALLTLIAFVLVNTAWLSEDIYITLRVVDNFVNGYGLTWNVAERVQAYTHPLWLGGMPSG